MKATGLDQDGVKLISPMDPSFDSTVDKIAARGFADLLKKSKPWVTVVSNESIRKIVAFSTVFRMTDGEGHTSTNSSYFVAPDAIGNPGLDFGHHSERGVAAFSGKRLTALGVAIPESEPMDLKSPDWDHDRTWQWIIDETGKFISHTAAEYSSARTVEIGLDAVIFEDGLLIGPDANGLAAHFDSVVRARQDLYRAIIRRIERGENVEAIFQAAIKENSPENSANLVDAGLMARSEALSAARALRKKYGDEKIREILQRALLPAPFVIRKK